jgi:hypothetical protein
MKSNRRAVAAVLIALSLAFVSGACGSNSSS